METGVHKNEQRNWEMPLPFRRKDIHLPNNRESSSQPLKWPHPHLKKKASDGKGVCGIHGKDHRKRPRLPGAGRVWYLPHFGVYHAKKPTQIRVVFDSSAEYEGVSLNGELLSRPDLMNSLLGVLFHF